MTSKMQKKTGYTKQQIADADIRLAFRQKIKRKIKVIAKRRRR